MRNNFFDKLQKAEEGKGSGSKEKAKPEVIN